MCFSAPISFLTSAGLAAAGTGSLKIGSKENRWLATVPFIFSVQQLIEGLQWIVEKPGTASLILGYAFLFFAYIVWPTYIPIGVYLHEKSKKVRTRLIPFVVAGILLSLSLVILLIIQPLMIETLSHHIYYRVDLPNAWIGAVIYVAIVAGSFFLSSDRYFRVFGIFVVFSAILATWIEATAFTSVWCFFAAVMSSLTLYYCYKHRGTKGA